MTKNLKVKAIIFALIILGCLYGFLGFPNAPTSINALKSNFKERIHLGLDLKGGTYLIIQVMTDDAINAETDQTIELLRTELLNRQMNSADLSKLNMDHIEIRGIDPSRQGDFRDLISEKFAGSWDLSGLAGDERFYVGDEARGGIGVAQRDGETNGSDFAKPHRRFRRHRTRDSRAISRVL